MSQDGQQVTKEPCAVPEVYGWCQYAEQVFIYMQRIEGLFCKRNASMTIEERAVICVKLRHAVEALSQLTSLTTIFT